MSFISSVPHKKYVNVVKTVIHAEQLNPGIRNTASWSAAKASAEPSEPADRIAKEIPSFSGKISPNTLFGTPDAAFATPRTRLRHFQKDAFSKSVLTVVKLFTLHPQAASLVVSSSHSRAKPTHNSQTGCPFVRVFPVSPKVAST